MPPPLDPAAVGGADGSERDRIPACIRRTVQDEKTHDFSGQVWHSDEPYQWKHDFDPGVLGPPRIYEVHVGMSGEEGRVHHYREFANTADPGTQTFEATFVLPRPEGLEVLPGMTANVSVDLSAYFEGESYFVPVTAVTADADLGAHVWVVDEATGQVSARPVTLGRMSGSTIEVFEGIQPGERVVTAGTGYLGEGMQVDLLPSLEQAEDNIPRSAPVQG